MSLPNILTLSRIGLAFFIVGFLSQNSLAGHIAAAVLFFVASVTDFYDGYFAKRQGLVSNFGKIMDPIADKVLILSVFAMLAYLGLFDGWMVMVIGAREISVTVSRLRAMADGRVLAAEQAGKIKTVFQIVTIAVALLFLVADQSAFAIGWFHKIEMGWKFLIKALMVISMLLTVISGALYFRHQYEHKAGAP